MTDRLRAPSHRPADTARARTVRPVALGVVTLSLLVAGCADDGGSSAPSDGEQLYADECAACHGADLRGTDVGPPLLSEIYAPDQLSDEAIRDAIHNGVTQTNWEFGPMPLVPRLDDDEITAIITYVRDVQEREGFEPYPPD